MEMYISSPDRSKRYVIDAFQSLVWNPLFDDVGDFEIVIDKSYSGYFLDDYIIELSTDSMYQGVIEYIDNDDNDTNTVTVKGHFMPSLLSRRAITTKTTYTDAKLETVVNALLKQTVQTGNSNRDVSIFVRYEPDSIRNTLVDCEVSTNTLLEELLNVVKKCYFGLNLYFNDNLTYDLTIYQGVERYQGENAIVLSKDRDSINRFEYVHSVDGYKNYAYILGYNDVTTEISTVEGLTPLTRREIFIDLSSIEQESMSLTQYKKVLQEQALIELQNYAQTDSITVESNNTYEYGKDFYIGDYVLAEDLTLDLSSIKQITGVSQVWDTDGYSIDIELGSQKGLVKYGTK